MTFLIAEISNHHLGSIDKAKQLILAAKNSGADAVKGQAFSRFDINFGTMPKEFYESCAMNYYQYRELIEFGEASGIPVFFTVLSVKLNALLNRQKFKKIHASLSSSAKKERFYYWDRENVFLSMKEPRADVKSIINAKILYATEYMEDVDLEGYEALQKFYGRDIGVSHHGKRWDMLKELKRLYKIPWIEKHFYLGDEIDFQGHIYRDCLHSMTPKEFEVLAKEFK